MVSIIKKSVPVLDFGKSIGSVQWKYWRKTTESHECHPDIQDYTKIQFAAIDGCRYATT